MTIPQSEYAARRQRLMQQMGDNSIALLLANSEVLRNGDVHYPFRQHSDFYYLTGFNEPDALLVLRPNHPDGEYILFNRPNDPNKEIWTGKRAGQQGACQTYHADKAFAIDRVEEKLVALTEGCQKIYYPLGRDDYFDDLIMDVLNQLRNKIRGGVNAPNIFYDIEPLVHEMRLIKSEAEIDCLRKAAQISSRAHNRAMQSCRPQMHESQLESEVLHEMAQHGCREVAYPSIVGGGANACVLHYIENNSLLNDNELVLIDSGGEYENYAADITRTFPINGKFSVEQKAIYQLVLAAQLAAIELVKPGITFDAPQTCIVKIITQGLVDLGILQGDVDQLIEDKTYQRFYMHNSGHWLGMDVHDAGNYKIDGKWRDLQTGMTITVEPGIYIAASSEDVDKKWWDIGVRIEDDVLVTEDGHEVLSNGAVKTIEEIENLMQHESA